MAERDAPSLNVASLGQVFTPPTVVAQMLALRRQFLGPTLAAGLRTEWESGALFFCKL